MADAMSYEYLLRRIYQVGRYSKKDVDADVYRSFEHAASLYSIEKNNIASRLPRIDNRSIEKLEAEYNSSARQIWQIISKALQAGYDKYGHRFSDAEKDTFQQLLKQPREITAAHIENVIDKAEAIFVGHQIFPA